MLVRTGITPRLFASRPDARVPPLPRGRRGRTARGGRRGAGGPRAQNQSNVSALETTVRPAGDARAVRGRVFRKRVYPAVYAIYTAPARQPASSLRPPGTSQRPRSSAGGSASRTGHCRSAQWADGAGPPPARRGDARARGVIFCYFRYNSKLGRFNNTRPRFEFVYRGTVRTPRGIRTVRYEA